MPTAYSILSGREVDTNSEEWRHECECVWLLKNKPGRSQKHLYLYGVPDRSQIVARDKDGREVLRENAKTIWGRNKPLATHRGLEAADRILADARRIHEHQNQPAAQSA